MSASLYYILWHLGLITILRTICLDIFEACACSLITLVITFRSFVSYSDPILWQEGGQLLTLQS